jgi:antitoxin HigA-1
MPMKNPPHPGRLIKDEIDELGLSVAQAAEGLGVTRQQLYRVINGECGISPEMAMRLERGIGSSAAAWLKMQMNYDLSQIQQRAAVMAVKKLRPKEVA